MVEINPVSTAAAKREKAILKRKRYEQLMQGLPIKLALSRTKGRHCVALSKLPAGTTVISETASAHVLLRPLVDELCLKCLQPLPFIETSSKPPAPAVSGGGFLSMSSRLAKRGICCGNCRKQTFYCSYACMESDSERHELECQVLIDLPGITAMHKCDYNLFRLVLSLLVNMALQRTEMLVFDSMDKLYEIRQKCPTPYSYVKDLISHKASQAPDWLACITAGSKALLQTLQKNSSIANYFAEQSLDEIVTLACQINSNSHGIHDPNSSSNSTIGVGIFPLCSMVNHSCSPNCCLVGNANGQMSIKTVRQVEEGEEVTLSYVDLFLPKEERRMKLLTTKFFWCNCSRCSYDKSSVTLDPDWNVEGVLCRQCRTLDKSSKSIYILNDKDNNNLTYHCLVCSHTMDSCEYKQIQQQAELQFEDAFKLYKSHQTAFARTLFEKLLVKLSAILHPHHHVVFNTLVPLMNIAMRQTDIVSASRYCRQILKTLEESKLCPDVWPERSEFLFTLGQMEVILGKAIAEGLIKDQNSSFDADEGIDMERLSLSNPNNNSHGDDKDSYEDCIKNAKAAFKECISIREIVYGLLHPKTLEVQEELSEISEE